MKSSKTDYYNSNEFTSHDGALFLEDYFNCSKNNAPRNSRYYHLGLKALLEDNSEDTVYIDDILVLAEGISPRMLLLY